MTEATTHNHALLPLTGTPRTSGMDASGNAASEAKGARGCYSPDELMQMRHIVSRMEARLRPFDMASRFDLDLGIFNNQHKRRVNQQQKTRPSRT